jgi:hypothetical protein
MDYGLDGGVSILGRINNYFYYRASRLALELTLFNEYEGRFPRGLSGRGVKMTTYLHLLSR